MKRRRTLLAPDETQALSARQRRKHERDRAMHARLDATIAGNAQPTAERAPAEPVFPKRSRVYAEGVLFGEAERYYFRVVTGTPSNRCIDGVGDLVPHVYVISEDTDERSWLPVSTLHLAPEGT